MTCGPFYSCLILSFISSVAFVLVFNQIVGTQRTGMVSLDYFCLLAFHQNVVLGYIGMWQNLLVACPKYLFFTYLLVTEQCA